MGLRTAFLRLCQGKSSKATKEEAITALDEAYNLALVCLEERHPDRALMLLGPVAQGRMQLLGDDDPKSLDAGYYLSIALLQLGRIAEGVQGLELTLAERDRVLGKDHPDSLMTAEKLTSLFGIMGRYDDEELLLKRLIAEDLINDILAGRERDVKDERLLHRLVSLATVWQRQGKEAAAEAMYKKGAFGMRDVLGPKHKGTVHSTSCLASLYLTQERLAEAEPLFKESLDNSDQEFTHDDPSIRSLIFHLSRVYLLHVASERRPESQKTKHDNSALGSASDSCARLVRLCLDTLDAGTAPVEALGQALVVMDMDQHALTALSYRSLNPINETRYPVGCDGCDCSITMDKERNICKTCFNQDLCADCAKAYREGTKFYQKDSKWIEIGQGKCQGHTLLTFPPATTLSDEETAEKKKEAAAWLRRLQSQFEKA